MKLKYFFNDVCIDFVFEHRTGERLVESYRGSFSTIVIDVSNCNRCVINLKKSLYVR